MPPAPKNGRLPSVENTVNLKKGTYKNSKSDTRLNAGCFCDTTGKRMDLTILVYTSSGTG
jgi:hypothetical protein